MCSKPPKPKKVEEKPVQYLRNPFLDDLSLGTDRGRNSLRIDLGSSNAPLPFEGTSAISQPKTSTGTGIPGLLIPTRTPTRTPRGSMYAQR